jgi:MFS superfamily sulfate permease-like transporter
MPEDFRTLMVFSITVWMTGLVTGVYLAMIWSSA